MLFKEKISEESKRLSNMYVNEVNTIPILNKQEQAELAKSWIEHGNDDARRRLIEANARLVIERALAMYSKTFPLIELIAVGNEGLLRAIETFDLSKDTKFSSHAYFWITARIKRYTKEYTEVIHKPHNQIDDTNRDTLNNDYIFKTTGYDLHDYTPQYSRIYDDVEQDDEYDDYDKELLLIEVEKLPDTDRFLLIEKFGLNLKRPLIDINKLGDKKDQNERIKELTFLLKDKLLD